MPAAWLLLMSTPNKALVVMLSVSSLKSAYTSLTPPCAHTSVNRCSVAEAIACSSVGLFHPANCCHHDLLDIIEDIHTSNLMLLRRLFPFPSCLTCYCNFPPSNIQLCPLQALYFILELHWIFKTLTLTLNPNPPGNRHAGLSVASFEHPTPPPSFPWEPWAPEYNDWLARTLFLGALQQERYN